MDPVVIRPARIHAWRVICLVWMIAVAACANPFPPTGGPEDRTPPSITSMQPADLEVNVSTETIDITFSEHIDQASFLRSFALTPDFAEPPRVSWRGRTVRIRLPEGLRENTTYVLQIDTNLRDYRGIRLTTPIMLAFATGPEINRGVIRGTVREAQRGTGVAGADVFAYARAPASGERPDYRTQTDEGGSFEFQYLPTGERFFIAVVMDENRNQRPDVGERFGAPSRPEIAADTLPAEPDRPWVLTSADTIQAEALRARPLSSRRIAVRFTRPVHPIDVFEPGWVIASHNGVNVPVRSVYVSATDAREVIAETDSLPVGSYELHPYALVDSAGRAVSERPVTFDAIARPDTARLRFLGFGPPSSDTETILPPDHHPSVRFSLPLVRQDVDRFVEIRDSLGAGRTFEPLTTTGTTWQLVAEPALGRGSPFTVRVRLDDDADTTYVRSFRRTSTSELGEISGLVAYPETERVIVEVRSSDGTTMRRSPTTASGTFMISELPAGQYWLRAYADPDSTSEWSGGLLVPYREPDPITWAADSVRVRARWETALEDTLRLVR